MNKQKIRFYTIGELSKILQLSSETIRYYEKINLIPKPIKFKNGYRKYSEIYIYRLKLIRKAKSFGFTLKEISEFFYNILNAENELVDLESVVASKLNDIEEQILDFNKKKELLIKFQYEIKELNCPVLEKVIEDNKKNA